MPSEKSLLLDSSVVVKWFIEEEDSKAALLLRGSFLRGDININLPELALYEIANALRYSALYSKEEIKCYLEALLAIDVEIIPFSFPCLSEAVVLSLEKNLAIYDAYFVACAKENGLVLVTADVKAFGKMADFGYVYHLKDLKELLA